MEPLSCGRSIAAWFSKADEDSVSDGLGDSRQIIFPLESYMYLRLRRIPSSWKKRILVAEFIPGNHVLLLQAMCIASALYWVFDAVINGSEV